MTKILMSLAMALSLGASAGAFANEGRSCASQTPAQGRVGANEAQPMSCTAAGHACTDNKECCSGMCSGKAGAKKCG